MRRFPETNRPARTDFSPADAFPNGHGGAFLVSDYLNIRDYLRILNKHRVIIAGILSAGVLAAVVYNWQATPIFEARATVQIEADPNVLALDRPLVDQRDWLREFLPTQVSILESRDIARKAQEQLKRPDSQNPPALEADRVPSVGDIMRGRRISPIRDTRLLSIGFRSTDPVLAARVANALTQTYAQQNIKVRTTTSGEASDWLTKQVEEQRKLVQASETALQRYRAKHGAEALFTDREGVERQNIVVQRLADLQTELTRARAEMIEKEAQYGQLTAVQGNKEALDTLPAIASNTYIQGLKGELSTLRRQMVQVSEELGERHPDRIKLQGAIQDAERKLQTEMSNVVQAMRNDLEAARSRERALVSALDRQRGEVQSLNAKSGQYTELEREATTNRDLLDKLLQRSREAALARDLKSSNVRIVDAAEVPIFPVLPRKDRNLGLALLGSGAFALGLVFLLELVNRRLTSPDDVKRHLGIPVLGIAPQVKSHNGHGSLLLSDRPPAQFTELVHGLRTNLLMSPELAVAHTLVVTSSEPGEGKTLTAANLATSFARLNQRVLLIDGDLRKPRLHQLFGQEQEPGLTDVLAKSFFEVDCELKRATTASAFRKTKVARLWLLPAGSTSRNPADLLGSERFSQFIDMLRPQFDWIVLDTPPVLAVTDACLIARVSSGVLFVVRCGQTSREVASAAVEQLNAAGANLVGAMLNRVELGRAGESYLPYYHREYANYYPQHEDTWLPEMPDAPASHDSTGSTPRLIQG